METESFRSASVSSRSQRFFGSRINGNFAAVSTDSTPSSLNASSEAELMETLEPDGPKWRAGGSQRFFGSRINGNQ